MYDKIIAYEIYRSHGMFDFSTPNQIIAQIIGFIALAIIVVGMQQKQYGRVVFCKIANAFLSVIHYLFLGGYTGAIINLASCFANGVYWHRNTKGKSVLPFQIAFGVMFVALGLLSWHGWISIFVIMAKLISSIALSIKNTRIIRILNLISNPCWLMYNLYMQSISAVLTDSLVIASVIIAIIRLDVIAPHKEKKQEKANF